MRRLRYQVAMSLDGYIAGPNGEADWIVMDPDLDFAALFAQFDTLVMGRKTFESTQAMGGGPSSGMSVVVVSRTMSPARIRRSASSGPISLETSRHSKRRRAKTSGSSAAAACSGACSNWAWWTASRWRSCRCCSAAAFRCCRSRPRAQG